MATGVLVHPLGHESHTLTEREYDDLKACLDIRRAPDDDLAQFILERLCMVEQNKDKAAPERIGYWLVDWMQQNEPDYVNTTEGILFGKGLVSLYSDTEFERLKEYLAVIRAGGWLPEFLTRVCHQKKLTPLLLMQSMTDEIEEFEQQRKSAEQFYKQNPDLLRKLVAPANPEPSQPKEEPPAKAQRARKPQKSAAA